MPPKQKLSDADVARLTRWVAPGASWPPRTRRSRRQVGGFQVTDAQSAGGPFNQSRTDSAGVKNVSWPRNEIDRFIFAELEAHGMQPAEPAMRHAWIPGHV